MCLYCHLSPLCTLVNQDPESILDECNCGYVAVLSGKPSWVALSRKCNVHFFQSWKKSHEWRYTYRAYPYIPILCTVYIYVGRVGHTSKKCFYAYFFVYLHMRVCITYRYTFLIISQSMTLSPFLSDCQSGLSFFVFFDLVKQLEFVSMPFSWIALRRSPFKPDIIYSGHDGANGMGRWWRETKRSGEWKWWRWISGSNHFQSLFTYPIASMYGIFSYIWLIFMVNVGIYTIHGWYG